MLGLCSLGSLVNRSAVSIGRAFSSHSDWIGSEALHLKLKQDESMI